MNSRLIFRLFTVIFGLTVVNTCILFAEHPVVAKLSHKFGQVMQKTIDNGNEFTVSAEFEDVTAILQTAESVGHFVSYAAVNSRDDGKIALIFRTVNSRTNAGSKFAKLQRLFHPGLLIWKSGPVPKDIPVITCIETDFSRKLAIKGSTRSSALIFSHLFPLIERIQEIQNPFFSRGTYTDTADGRIMDFQIDCTW